MGPEQRAENDDDDQELIQVLNDVEEMFGQPVFSLRISVQFLT